MNGYAQRLLDVAAQLRSLGGQAGTLNNHLPTFEALAKDAECIAMAIEAGLAGPARVEPKLSAEVKRIPAPLTSL